jgi:FdhD protein
MESASGPATDKVKAGMLLSAEGEEGLMSRDVRAYKSFDVAHYEDGLVETRSQDLVREEPLLIRVEDKPYSVVMRTPGQEIAHAAGFCLSEGVLESPEDIASIGYCSDVDENSVTVLLSEAKKRSGSGVPDTQAFVSRSSCGICGREMIEDLAHNLAVSEEGSAVSYEQVFACMDNFTSEQEHYARTRGTHAVMLFDSRLDIISKAEDVGRHNAMDKSIGALFLERRLSDVFLAVLSSRVSFEMIQKAARARIPILVSISNPTSMAVELGLKLNMTVISLDKKSGFVVFSGSHRVSKDLKA